MLSRLVDLAWSLLTIMVALFLDESDCEDPDRPKVGPDLTVPEAEEGGLAMSRGCGCNSP